MGIVDWNCRQFPSTIPIKYYSIGWDATRILFTHYKKALYRTSTYTLNFRRTLNIIAYNRLKFRSVSWSVSELLKFFDIERHQNRSSYPQKLRKLNLLLKVTCVKFMTGLWGEVRTSPAIVLHLPCKVVHLPLGKFQWHIKVKIWHLLVSLIGLHFERCSCKIETVIAIDPF